jgi:hypothetical protein
MDATISQATGGWLHKAGGSAAGCKLFVSEGDTPRLDDSSLPSTAASSVLNSPNAGPEGFPEGVAAHDNLELADLGPALAVLHPHLKVVAAGGQLPRKEQSVTQQIKQHVERYFAAENLYQDMCVRSLMTPFGWVHLNDVVQFPELQQLDATVEAVAWALRGSWVVQLSGDSRRLRARVDAWWASGVAWAPLLTAMPPTCAGKPAELAPEGPALADVPDEDLTIAASVEWRPKQKEKNRQGSAPLRLPFDSEVAPALEEEPSSGVAWLRFSDDGYPSAASSILQW